jgi:hypothetical protein
MKKGNEVYSKEPWNSMDEYYNLGMKYGMWGSQLKQFLKKVFKKIDLIPNIKPKLTRGKE